MDAHSKIREQDRGAESGSKLPHSKASHECQQESLDRGDRALAERPLSSYHRQERPSIHDDVPVAY
ncbi:MAG: hypothetical protein ACLQVG_22525 [Terriglobia bacterium]